MTIRDRLRRLLAGAPVQAECPLPGCETCPGPAPLDVVAEEQRARDLAYTMAWLIERYPDAWYFDLGDTLPAFAAGILELKLQVRDGRMAP